VTGSGFTGWINRVDRLTLVKYFFRQNSKKLILTKSALPIFFQHYLQTMQENIGWSRGRSVRVQRIDPAKVARQNSQRIIDFGPGSGRVLFAAVSEG
jgi:hypothetical protein